MYNTILQTGPLLPQSVIANGLSTGVGWTNTQNFFQADGQLSASSTTGASDVVIGNYNFALPQNAVVVGIEMTVIGQSNGSPQVSPPLTLTPYAYDDTGTVPASYPYNPPLTSLTPTLSSYLLGTPNYLFATSWTVDQINNFKLDLVANGGMLIDTVLVNVYYYLVAPSSGPVEPGDSCESCNSPVQAPFFNLATPLLPTDTSMTLTSFNFANGQPIPMSALGACGGWLSMTIDPGLRLGSDGTGNFEENVIVTSWSILPSGNVVLNFGSLTNRGITPYQPYTSNSGSVSGHVAGAKVVLSDNAEFMNRFVRACQVGIVFSAPITVESESSVVTDPTTVFNFGTGFSVTQDISNPEQVNIIASGSSVPPPQIVGTGSGSSGNVQVNTIQYQLPVSGVNRAASVQISTQESVTIASVTVGGVSCTQEEISTNTPNDIREETWVCVAPPVGLQNVIITLTGSEVAYVTSGAESWIGIDQSTPVGATQAATSSSVNPNLSITTTRDNSIIVDGLATAMTPILYSPGSGQALNWSLTANTNTRQGGSSIQPSGVSPDVVLMQYNITQNTTWCYTAVEMLGIQASTGVTKIVAGSNVTISPPGGTGVVTINAAGSGSGITSINGDSTPAQVIAAGVGISVTSSGGTTTITNTGGSGGSGGGGGRYTSGTVAFNGSSSTTTIAHGLGVTPSHIKISAYGLPIGANSPQGESVGTYNGTNTETAYVYYGGGNVLSTGTDTTNIVIMQNDSGSSHGVATFNSTDIIITWTNAGGGIASDFLWEAYDGGASDSEPFVYGETIALNDYVFQATGNETILLTDSPGTGGDYQVQNSNEYPGDLFTFTDPRVAAVRSVKFTGFRPTFGAGNLTAQIFATSGGLPTGSALATSNNLATNTFSTGLNGYSEFIFPSPFAVTTGTTYAVILNTSAATGFSSSFPLGFRTNGSDLPTILSTNSGSTWSAPGGGQSYSQMLGTITAGQVFKVDLVTPIYNMGAYKGFALSSGVVTNVNNVQLSGTATGFTSLTIGQNVYINPSTAGGIIQTPGITAGRSVGVAISATEVQLALMRKRDSGETYSFGSTINQDGFLVVVTNTTGGINAVLESDGLSTVQIAQIGFVGGGSGADTFPAVTVPVRAGYFYTVGGSGSYSAIFYPLING